MISSDLNSRAFSAIVSGNSQRDLSDLNDLENKKLKSLQIYNNFSRFKNIIDFS